MNKESAMNFREMSDSSRARLIADVKAVVADAEDYLAASLGQTGEAYAVARRRLERTVDAAKAQLAETHRVLDQKTRAAARATDTYVHEKPWESIALGAGIGFLVGLLMARR